MDRGIGAKIDIVGMRKALLAFDALDKVSKSQATREVQFAALAIQAEANRLVHMPGTGRVYTRRSIEHQASAPFQPPATDTGMLAAHITASGAITFENGGLTAEIGPRNYAVAVYLEFGTRTMAPRPFMHPAFNAKLPKFTKDLKAALRRELGKGRR